MNTSILFYFYRSSNNADNRLGDSTQVLLKYLPDDDDNRFSVSQEIDGEWNQLGLFSSMEEAFEYFYKCYEELMSCGYCLEY